MFVDWPIAMPPDAGARIVPDQQCLDEQIGLESGERGYAISDR